MKETTPDYTVKKKKQTFSDNAVLKGSLVEMVIDVVESVLGSMPPIGV